MRQSIENLISLAMCGETGNSAIVGNFYFYLADPVEFRDSDRTTELHHSVVPINFRKLLLEDIKMLLPSGHNYIIESHMDNLMSLCYNNGTSSFTILIYKSRLVENQLGLGAHEVNGITYIITDDVSGERMEVVDSEIGEFIYSNIESICNTTDRIYDVLDTMMLLPNMDICSIGYRRSRFEQRTIDDTYPVIFKGKDMTPISVRVKW